MTDSPLAIGDQLGDYRILAELGRGGMGVVYQARHATIGQHVAVKVLRRDSLSSVEDRARFLREGRVTAALSHPGLVQVFGFGETAQGHIYLLMELLHGELLSAWLARQSTRQLSWQAAGWVAAQLAATLAAVHQAGVVHRDIKPQKIPSVEKSSLLVRRPSERLRTTVCFPRSHSADGL